MTERKATETTESEAKSPQECPHCGAFYDNADSFKDHVEQHEREGTGDNAEKDRQNQDYPEGWQGETAPRGEEPADADSVDYEWEENYDKEGEAKASESAYDKAKWLAKAKLEEGGLDIVSALPDIITDIIGLEDYQGAGDLTRAIEEAIAEYKESISTGMSMWGNIKSSETEPKLDTVEDIDDYIKNGKEDEDKDEAEEIIGAIGMAEDLKDTYGSSANADPTTQPLEDHSGNDDSSDAITEADTEDEDEEDLSDQPHHKFGTIEEVDDDEPADNDDEMKDGWRYEDTVEESFGDCGCKDTKKARMSWESASENDKQYWLRDMGVDEGYSFYYFEHLPKRIGESFVNKFKVEQSEDRGWSKIPALERADLLKKLGFPPRDAELVANLEYPQLSESLKKDVNDAVSVKKRAEESQREKPDEQLSFENDLYSNMYDGYLNRRGQRVESKKNDKF